MADWRDAARNLDLGNAPSAPATGGWRDAAKNLPGIDPETHRIVAETSTPEEEAEISMLAEKTRMPANLVRINVAAAKNRAERDEINNVLATAPKTNEFFKSPQNLAAARRDAKGLADIEHSFGNPGEYSFKPGHMNLWPVVDNVIAPAIESLAKQGVKTGPRIAALPYQIIGGVAGVIDSTERGIGNVLGTGSTGMFATVRDWAIANSTEIINKYANADMLKVREELRGKGLWDNPELLKDPEWLAYNIGEVGGSLLPQLLAAKMTGGSTLVGTSVGASQEAGDLYMELLNDGVDPDAALSASLFFGIGVGYLNKFGLDAILGKNGTSKAAARIAKSVLGAGAVGRMAATGATSFISGATEAITEWGEEPLQAFLGSIAKGNDPNTVVADTIKAMKNIDVMVGSFFLGGGGGLLSSDANKHMDDLQAADDAVAFKDKITRLQGLVGKVELSESNPAMLEKFLVEELGMKDQEAFIDGDAIIDLQQSAPEAFNEIAKATGAPEAEVLAAAKEGRGIKVNLGAYLTRLTPETRAATLDHLKATPGGYSVAQVKEGLAMSDEAFEERLTGFMAESQDMVKEQQRLEQELLATGRVPAAVKTAVDAYTRIAVSLATKEVGGSAVDIMRKMKVGAGANTAVDPLVLEATKFDTLEEFVASKNLAVKRGEDVMMRPETAKNISQSPDTTALTEAWNKAQELKRTLPDADGIQYDQSGNVILNDAFWSWFGNSAAVDANGVPRLAYTGGVLGVGVYKGRRPAVAYFAYDRDSAQVFAERAKDNEEPGDIGVSAHFLRIVKPFDYRLESHRADLASVVDLTEHELGLLQEGSFHLFEKEHIINALKALGYDSFYEYEHMAEREDQQDDDDANVHIGVFEPNQIKSVNNQGTWDGGNPNVYMQSVRSWGETDKQQLAADLMAAGMSEEDTLRAVSDVEAVARTISENAEILDYIADRSASSVKTNSDAYYIKSLDFSTICRKAARLVATVADIQKKLDRPLTSDEWIEVRRRLADKKDIVSCLACYVFSKKIQIGTALTNLRSLYPEVPAEVWADPQNHVMLSAYPTSRAAAAEIAKTRKFDGKEKQLGRPLTLDEKINDVLERIPNAKAYLGTRGQGIGEAFEPRTDYRGELRSGYSPAAVRMLNKVSGHRAQSWSDFEPIHLIDKMQATLDAAAVNMAVHSYTKEPNYVRLQAPTGEMVNMSLIPEGSGLKKGKLVFSDVEGMPIKISAKLRKEFKTAGTIAIGVSDEHIRALMNDPRVDYIIPYHASGLAKEVIGTSPELKGWFDYQAARWTDGVSLQSEGVADQDKFKAYMAWKTKSEAEGGGGMLSRQKEVRPWEYWDANADGDTNAKNYLEYCEKNGIRPKFPQFAGADLLTPEKGYWKTLVDRRMYDDKGVYIKQMPLRPTWDMDTVNDILTGVIKGEIPATGDYTPNMDVVNEFVAEIEKQRQADITLQQTRQHFELFQSIKHGTPYIWPPEKNFPHGRPRLDKIGTGEGGAAYGWGWYGAEAEGVAGTYKKNLSRRNAGNSLNDAMENLLVDGKPVLESYDLGMDRLLLDQVTEGDLPLAITHAEDMLETWEAYSKDKTYPHQDYAREKARAWKAFLPKLKTGRVTSKLEGSLYTLDLPDDVIPTLLDWDKPLSQQSAILSQIKEAFRKRGFTDQQISSMLGRDITGEQAYTYLAGIQGRKAASDVLASIGIPGNRYLDQQSRYEETSVTRTKGEETITENYDSVAEAESAAKEWRDKGWTAERTVPAGAELTSNYVIWDQAVLDRMAVLERNGEKLDAIRELYQGTPQTETEAFKKWFGNSKVVDENGKPLVVYHGTALVDSSDGSFSDFNTDSEMGAHFAVNPKLAEEHTEGADGEIYDGAQIFPVYLSIKNPLILSDAANWDDVGNFVNVLQDDMDVGRIDQAVGKRLQKRIQDGFAPKDAIQAEGYDGIQYDNEYEDAWDDSTQTGGSVVSYIAFSPTQIKSVYNRGTWDGGNPDIRYQDSAATEDPLGSVQQFSDGYLINLFENANESTPFHEAAHIYLLEMVRISQGNTGTEAMHREMATIMDWLGVTSVDQITRGHHEMFARGFEAYLMEGKAPVPELIPAFKRFQRWLKAVYKQAAALGVKLTPEIRKIFDGMLAAEAAVDQATAAAGMAAMTKAEMDALGIIPEDQAYLAKLYDDAQLEAERAYGAAIKKGLSNNRSSWREEGERAADANLMHTIVRSLQKGAGVDRAAVIETWGEAVINRMPAGLKQVFKSGGMNPDEAAYEAGFDSAEQLFDALESYISRDQEIKNHIQMREQEFNASLDPADFIFETQEFADYLGVVSNYTEGMMGQQAQLDESLKPKDKEGNTRKLTKKGMARSAFKMYAKRIIDSMSRKDAMRTDKFMGDVKRAAQLEKAAIKRGDWAAAQAANQQMRLNFELARESREAREAVAKLERAAKRVLKATPAKVDGAFHGAAMKLAMRLGLIQITPEQRGIVEKAGKINSLLSGVDDEMGADDFGFAPMFTESDAAIDYKELTADETEQLRTIINALMHMGREKITPMLTSLGIPLEDARTDLMAALSLLKDKPKWQKRGKTFLGMDPVAWLRKQQDRKRAMYADTYQFWAMIRILDGFVYYENGVGGPFEQYFRDNWERAYAKKSTDSKYYQPKLKAAFAKMFAQGTQKGAPVWWNNEVGVAVPRTLAADGQGWGWDAIVTVALNVGNESNLQRLKEGYGWTDEQVNQILAVIDDSTWDAVQEAWDIFEEMRPEFFATGERINGIAAPHIQPRAFVTPTGKTMRGGYVPAVYDPGNTRAAELDEAQLLKESANSAFQRPKVNDRAQKARAGSGAGRPIRLDTSGIIRQYDYNLQYTAFAEAIRDMSRLLNDQALSDAIADKVGREWLPAMRNVLAYVANPGRAQRMTEITKGLKKLASRTSRYILGFGRAIGVKQLFSIPMAYTEGGSWHRGLTHVIAHPKLAWDEMLEESPAMYQRFSDWAIDRDVQKLKQQLLKNSKLAGVPEEWIDVACFAMIRGADIMAVLPMYYGTKIKMERKFGPGAQAIRATEKIIQDTQPMSREIDMSTLQLDRESLSRMFTFFSGFTGKFENYKRPYTRGFMEGKIPLKKFAHNVLITRVVPPMLMNMMFAFIFGNDQDPEDILWDTLLYQVCGFPIIRELAILGANAVRRATDPNFKGFSAFGTPLSTVPVMIERNVSKIAGWFSGDVGGEDAAVAAADLILTAKGVPAVKAVREAKESYRQFENSSGPDAWLKLLIKPDPDEKLQN